MLNKGVPESRRRFEQKKEVLREEQSGGRVQKVTKWVTYSLIGTDGVDLGAEHHRGEDEEEKALKA